MPPIRSRLFARAALSARLAAERFDVLVIGGGITGAGVARDAALRGLRTALVERDDFASGTSSRSSRLVHGGVRYLEHGYLHLVFEASRERRTLLHIAPELVHPLQFTWPVYRGARLPRWKIVAGLWLYDLLSIFRNAHPHRALSVAGVLAEEPRLRHEQLTGGALYFDAATDDARLTLANVISAVDAGAAALNYVEATALRTEAGRACGATVRDRRSGATFDVRARVVVNACGPWTDTIAHMEDPTAPPALRGSKGVHITVPADRIGNRNAVTMLDPADGRVMFTLPQGDVTIIGTTETETHADPHEVRPSRADVQYLVDGANAFWPAAMLTLDDVITAWAGIRPLVASHAANAGSASREHAITVGKQGVVAITGGKLTTYRAMAEEVVDTVERHLGRRATPARTAHERLPLPAREFACTVADVLVRRTKVAFNTRDHGLSQAEGVARELGDAHGWDDAARAKALDDYRAEIARLFTIEP
ncbi:MAG: glycerol-3-phosphate dehydrogenase/oxidase [Gemmatimonadetes bacterium]|nr:glycerol-3-phosphate dehydrogenase/oxidase [Gemmatimonadota bacterium]MBI3569251.1 glycerol-3-phosphate dehydrogenase/oxidase [Gemmatimonadota bacterium]